MLRYRRSKKASSRRSHSQAAIEPSRFRAASYALSPYPSPLRRNCRSTASTNAFRYRSVRHSPFTAFFTSRPPSWCSVSGIAPRRSATTGVRHAIASVMAMQFVSAKSDWLVGYTISRAPAICRYSSGFATAPAYSTPSCRSSIAWYRSHTCCHPPSSYIDR